jgi:hypothetical protein
LQHVVATFHPVDGRKIYVNGVLVADQDPAPGGSLADWDDTFAFVLGNEVSSDRTWMGVIRLVAIHNRVLTPGQITQNFEAGVGEKFFLLFSVEHLINVPQSYVVLEAAQFDSFGYLFRNPFFISLDGAVAPNGIDIEGLRVGLNGAEAPVGQTFANLDTAVSSVLYQPATGQSLAELGAVLPLEKGPEDDEFFLTFDRLGNNSFSRPPPVTPDPPTPQDLAPASDIGVRTFDEINASMSAITGVAKNQPDVLATYTQVKQSLPAVDTIEAFLSSHQMAIAQLAIEYCNALVEDTDLRAAVFPTFNFNAAVATAFPGPGAVEDAFLEPLLDRVIGTAASPIATQPVRADVKTELTQLIHGGADPIRPGLAAGGGAAGRTQTIAKAVCSAAVGSGAMLFQ